MTDKLQAYRLDKAFTDGVEFRLDRAPDVTFIIRLPSQYNRAYMQAIYGAMTIDMGGNVPKPAGNLLETRYTQERAFVEHCMMSIDDEPVPADFAECYPDALSELMEKATSLANTMTQRVEDAAKKSSTSLSGNEAGQEKSGSMQSLKRVEGSAAAM